MDRSTLRIISKAGFILVIAGFFMPCALNLNGFQIADNLLKTIGSNILSHSLYIIFVASFFGVLLFILLIINKYFSIIFDWVLLSVIYITLIIAYLRISDIGGSFGISGSDKLIKDGIGLLQYGAYMINFGLILATIFNVFASIIKILLIYLPDSTNNYYFPERNCTTCGKLIEQGYSGCPHCGYYDLNIKSL